MNAKDFLFIISIAISVGSVLVFMFGQKEESIYLVLLATLVWFWSK